MVSQTVDQEKYEAVESAIRNVCIETVIKIKEGDGNLTCMFVHSELRLSHVLRAIKEKCPFGKVTEFYDGETMDEGQEQFERQSMRILREWNLTEDDLSKQSPEVIYFLWEVLCKI